MRSTVNRGASGPVVRIAIATTVVLLVPLVAGLGLVARENEAVEAVLLNGFIVVFFSGSAWLFLRSAQRHYQPGES